MAEQAGDFVEHHELGGVADGDHQDVAFEFERDEVEAEHELDRDGAKKVVLDFEVLEVGELGTVAAGHQLGLRTFIESAATNSVW